MGFLKKAFKLKNLLKAAAIAAAAYTGGTSLGLIGGPTAAASAGAGAAGAAGSLGGGATFGSALSSIGGGALSLGSGIANVAPKISGLLSVANMVSGEPKAKAAPVINPAEAPAFSPLRPSPLAMPSSLSDMGGMNEMQQRSALATRGLEQGLGSEEEQYYNNLVQRSLVDDRNSVGGIDRLLPIEKQYYKRKGFNSSDPYELLRSLQQG